MKLFSGRPSIIHSAGFYPPSDPAPGSGYFAPTAAAIGRRGGSRTTFLSPAASCRCASLTMSWSRNPSRAANCSRTALTSATTGSVSMVDLQKFLRGAHDRAIEPHLRQTDSIRGLRAALAICLQFQVRRYSTPLTAATTICRASVAAFGRSGTSSLVGSDQ